MKWYKNRSLALKFWAQAFFIWLKNYTCQFAVHMALLLSHILSSLFAWIYNLSFSSLSGAPPSVRNPWICPVPLFTLLLLFPFYVRNLFVLIPSFYYLSSFLVSMSSFRGVYAHRVSSQHGIHLHCIKGGQSKLIESMYGRGNIFNFFNRQRIWMLT